MQAGIWIEPDWFGKKNCLLWYRGEQRVSHTFGNEVGRGRRWEKTLRLELKVYFKTVRWTISDQYVILRNKGRFISVLPCQTYTCTDCNVLCSDVIFFRRRGCEIRIWTGSMLNVKFTQFCYCATLAVCHCPVASSYAAQCLTELSKASKAKQCSPLRKAFCAIFLFFFQCENATQFWQNRDCHSVRASLFSSSWLKF